MRKWVASVERKKEHDKDSKDNLFSLTVVVSDLGATNLPTKQGGLKTNASRIVATVFVAGKHIRRRVKSKFEK